jgi:succinate dehydrogenase/fumarate reductase flavoprotein subunit
MAQLDPKIPKGDLDGKWLRHKADTRLVNPSNKRKYEVIVVGAGLAGASASATLCELGYKVQNFVFHDSPRRAHSIAAQGGINAAKNYQNDGDSVYRLFYDTVKGGDYRSREANVHRLAEVSVDIIDQCVAQGVPFAREYGGLLSNRSFGGAQVSRTFYARGQTGQQLLLGAYSALSRGIAAGGITPHTQSEMLDLVVVDGHAKGIIVRDLVTGKVTRHAADAVILATGGYGNVFNLSTYARGSNATAIWRAYKRGACFANPCFTQIHPTCIPVEADPHVGVAAQRRADLGAEEEGGQAQGPGLDTGRRARLLPRADLPQLRQPLPARRGVARSEARLRRGARGGGQRARRVPGLRGRDRAPRRGGGPRALRQPLRHLPRDHERERLQGPDEDLPGGPLHDGRPLGGL